MIEPLQLNTSDFVMPSVGILAAKVAELVDAVNSLQANATPPAQKMVSMDDLQAFILGKITKDQLLGRTTTVVTATPTP